jgi:hypothetical protein
MLADIGLTRSDLLAAGSAPLWQNPTSILEQRVSSRRPAMPRATQQSDEPTVPHHFDVRGKIEMGARTAKLQPIGGSHAQTRLCGLGETDPCEYI